jgi:hypothetical protein
MGAVPGVPAGVGSAGEGAAGVGSAQGALRAPRHRTQKSPAAAGPLPRDFWDGVSGIEEALMRGYWCPGGEYSGAAGAIRTDVVTDEIPGTLSLSLSFSVS